MVVAAAVAMGEMDMSSQGLAKTVTVLADGGDVKDGLARNGRTKERMHIDLQEENGRRGLTLAISSALPARAYGPPSSSSSGVHAL